MIETNPDARMSVLNSRGRYLFSMERLVHPLVRSRKNLGCDELAFDAFNKKVTRANRSWEKMQSPASGGTLATVLLRSCVHSIGPPSWMRDRMDNGE